MRKETRLIADAFTLVGNMEHDLNPLGAAFSGNSEMPQKLYIQDQNLVKWCKDNPESSVVWNAIANVFHAKRSLSALGQQMKEFCSRVRSFIKPTPKQMDTQEVVQLLHSMSSQLADGPNSEYFDKIYFELVCHLVYTTYQTLQLLDNLLQFYTGFLRPTHSCTEVERQQIINCTKALHNSQGIWHYILKAPCTLAWTLQTLIRTGIFADQPATSDEWMSLTSPITHGELMGGDHSGTGQTPQANERKKRDRQPQISPSRHLHGSNTEEQDQPLPGDQELSTANEDAAHGVDQLDNNEELRKEAFDVPQHITPVRDSIKNTDVMGVFVEAYRLGSVTRRQREAERDIGRFIETPCDHQKSIASFDIDYVCNVEAPVSYSSGSIIRLVRQDWEELSKKHFSSDIKKGIAMLGRWLQATESNVSSMNLPKTQPKIHCELILMMHYLRNCRGLTRLPQIGVSRAACGTCSLFIEGIIENFYKDNKQKKPEVDQFVPGTRRDAFWPCTLPINTPANVMKHVADGLEKHIEHMLTSRSLLDAIDAHVTRTEQGDPTMPTKHDGATTPASNRAETDDEEECLDKK